ncbi:hypothetical protein TEA_020039 [Camellia sinensis var. sinensis]|uniref:LIM zinc-binding domain-containing protein n=1 Tax=Camellia sinensis var. sinensis TaxID=542762 RepID=A0A4S4DP24_CAMSN|nr:hypothetical protein TEA_020039 [Camellia sinensis var. sinensis]
MAGKQVRLFVIMSFTGTQQKCKACEKTVYQVELLSADGVSYHKACFKCSHCKGTLKLSNYSSMEGVLYCKPHFDQLFKESGNFNKNFQSRRQGRLAKLPACSLVRKKNAQHVVKRLIH